MREITDELFSANSSERWHIIFRSIFYTFLAASSLLLLGVSPEVSSFLAAGVASVSYYGQVNRFAEGVGTTHKGSEINHFHALSVASYAILVIFIVVITLRSPAAVEAAVVKWRIAAINRSLGGSQGSAGQQLPALASALTTARRHDTRIRPAVQREIGDSLAAARSLNLPGYLPAAGAFINYQSAELVPGLPNCLETVPEHLTWQPLGDLGSPDVNPPPDQIKFARCHLALDSPIFAQEFHPKTQTDALSLVCEKCEITYDGGELPIAKVKGYVNLIFTDCAFIVHLRDDSPGEAKGLVSAILNSPDTNNVHYIAAGKDIWSGVEVRPHSDN
jgi:hypothetical protein